MTPCPGLAQLERLLKGELSPGARPGVAAHVDSCPACRRAFEALSAGQTLEAAPGQQPPDGSLWVTLARPPLPSTIVDGPGGPGRGSEAPTDPFRPRFVP